MSISSSLFHFEKTEIDFVGGKSENAKSISWNCWNLIYWVQLANYLLFLEQFKGKKLECPIDPPRASPFMPFESYLNSFVGIIANISGCHIPHSLDRPGYIAISWTHSVDVDSPLGSQKYIGAGCTRSAAVNLKGSQFLFFWQEFSYRIIWELCISLYISES